MPGRFFLGGQSQIVHADILPAPRTYAARASIALAGAALDDVEKCLPSRALECVRYVDDFRIFRQSKKTRRFMLHMTGLNISMQPIGGRSPNLKQILYSAKRFINRESLDPREEEERGKEVLENTGYSIDFEELPESDPHDVIREISGGTLYKSGSEKTYAPETAARPRILNMGPPT